MGLLCFLLLLVPIAHLSNGSIAPSPGGLVVSVSLVPLGSTATHDPTGIPRALWARWKPLDATSKNESLKMSI